MECAVFLKGASWKAISIALVYPLGKIIGVVETVAGIGHDPSSGFHVIGMPIICALMLKV